jgi:hypothetical protein
LRLQQASGISLAGIKRWLLPLFPGSAQGPNATSQVVISWFSGSAGFAFPSPRNVFNDFLGSLAKTYFFPPPGLPCLADWTHHSSRREQNVTLIFDFQIPGGHRSSQTTLTRTQLRLGYTFGTENSIRPEDTRLGRRVGACAARTPVFSGENIHASFVTGALGPF